VSHPEQIGFFRAVALANQPLVRGGRVLEVGAYDVNGTIRNIFAESSGYVGLDLTEGPGVDHVGYGHEFDGGGGSFDLSISGECFEHDQHWAATFANMARLTRPGGLVAFSCASRGRPEHGTVRTDSTLSPGTQAVGEDYYRNLVAADFEREIDLAALFSTWKFWSVSTHCDLYFAGVRASSDPGLRDASLPDDAEIAKLSALMPLVHRLARVPLSVLARTRLSEEGFQNLTFRYWNLLLRVAGEELEPLIPERRRTRGHRLALLRHLVELGRGGQAVPDPPPLGCQADHPERADEPESMAPRPVGMGVDGCPDAREGQQEVADGRRVPVDRAQQV
jgi:SAM-dependent methyltransferase